MVWNQYVYEATTGNDVDYESDNENYDNDYEHTIEDWEIEYSDELHHMWNTMNTLLYDAQIQHSGKFCDFVEFCYIEHDAIERDTWDHQEDAIWYEERLSDVWKHLLRIIRANVLREQMMRGATFDHFVAFAKNIMCIY